MKAKLIGPKYDLFKNTHIGTCRFAIVLLMISLTCLINFNAYSIAHHHKRVDRSEAKNWVGTWGTARQLVEPHNIPPAPGLSNNTLRQVVCVSIGGKNLRLRLSNEFGKSPLTMKMVQLAVSKGGNAIQPATSRMVKFNGRSEVTIQPGAEIFSDPVNFDLKPRMEVAITIAFGETPVNITGHPGSRTTSYLVAGNQTAPGYDFAEAVRAEHWYFISGIDVEAPRSAGAVVVFGDSITDGRGSGTDKQNRWPDILSMNLLQKLNPKQVGVLNMGIGGNALLRGGLGPTGLTRFDHDVLKQSHVRWLIVFEGVNDLGGSRDSIAAYGVAKGLIAAYDKMITEAHASGIKVYGATIMPFKKNSYYTTYRDGARNLVNDWIRNSGHFDAVIDFDKVMRDPNAPDTLLSEAQSGANDFLHPNEFGYQLMGKAVDVLLFK